MLRKNKGFLDGVNMVESQIVYTDAQTEDQKHRRRAVESHHDNRYPTRKAYNYQPVE
jgi:hypothetical protein